MTTPVGAPTGPPLKAPGNQWFDPRNPRDIRISGVIATVAGLGAVACFVVISYTYVAGRPLGNAAALGFVAIPVIACGQLWAMAIMKSRMPPRDTRPRRRSLRRPRSQPRRQVFTGDLPLWIIAVVSVVALGGWLVAITSWPSLNQGGPTHSTANCVYPLDNHGGIVCVTRARYLQAGAAEQRFMSGVLLFFFATHTLVSGSVVMARSRRTPR